MDSVLEGIAIEDRRSQTQSTQQLPCSIEEEKQEEEEEDKEDREEAETLKNGKRIR